MKFKFKRSTEESILLNEPPLQFIGRYIGNSPCMVIKGEGCADKAIRTIWDRYREKARKSFNTNPALCNKHLDSKRDRIERHPNKGRLFKNKTTPQDNTVAAASKLTNRSTFSTYAYLTGMDQSIRELYGQSSMYPKVKIIATHHGLELETVVNDEDQINCRNKSSFKMMIHPNRRNQQYYRQTSSPSHAGQNFIYRPRRILHVTASQSIPGLFAWVYRHNDGKRYKPECRCHVVMLYPASYNDSGQQENNSYPKIYHQNNNRSTANYNKFKILNHSLANSNYPIALVGWRGIDVDAEKDRTKKKHSIYDRIKRHLSISSDECSISTFSDFPDPELSMYRNANNLSEQTKKLLFDSLREFKRERLARQQNRQLLSNFLTQQLAFPHDGKSPIAAAMNGILHGSLATVAITTSGMFTKHISQDETLSTSPNYSYPKRKITLMAHKSFRDINFHSYNGFRISKRHRTQYAHFARNLTQKFQRGHYWNNSKMLRVPNRKTHLSEEIDCVSETSVTMAEDYSIIEECLGEETCVVAPQFSLANELNITNNSDRESHTSTTPLLSSNRELNFHSHNKDTNIKKPFPIPTTIVSECDSVPTTTLDDNYSVKERSILLNDESNYLANGWESRLCSTPTLRRVRSDSHLCVKHNHNKATILPRNISMLDTLLLEQKQHQQRSRSLYQNLDVLISPPLKDENNNYTLETMLLLLKCPLIRKASDTSGNESVMSNESGYCETASLTLSGSSTPRLSSTNTSPQVLRTKNLPMGNTGNQIKNVTSALRSLHLECQIKNHQITSIKRITTL